MARGVKSGSRYTDIVIPHICVKLKIEVHEIATSHMRTLINTIFSEMDICTFPVSLCCILLILLVLGLVMSLSS